MANISRGFEELYGHIGRLLFAYDLEVIGEPTNLPNFHSQLIVIIIHLSCILVI